MHPELGERVVQQPATNTIMKMNELRTEVSCSSLTNKSKVTSYITVCSFTDLGFSFSISHSSGTGVGHTNGSATEMRLVHVLPRSPSGSVQISANPFRAANELLPRYPLKLTTFSMQTLMLAG